MAKHSTIWQEQFGYGIDCLTEVEPKTYVVSYPLPPSRVSWLRQQSRHVPEVSNRRLSR